MSKLAVLATGAAAIAAVSMLAPTAASAATRTTVTVVATSAARAYGTADPAFGYTTYGLARGDKLLRKPTCRVAATHRNVGKYAITCSGALVNSKKYTIAYRSGTLYVGRASASVIPDYRRKVYGDPDPAITYQTYGLVNGDKLITTPTCTVATPHSDVNRYPIHCTGANAGGNYDLRSYDGVFEVGKAKLLVGPDPQAIYYGSAEPKFTYSVLGLVGNDKLVTEPKCDVAAPHVHVGDYTITCTGAAASANYDLSVITNPYKVGQNKTVIVADKAAIGKNILGQPTGAVLRAQLYIAYPYGRVFADQPMTFKTGETVLCTDVITDENGYASCNVSSGVAALVKNGSYTVTYAGQGEDITGAAATVENN